jgi:hypothetical protein
MVHDSSKVGHINLLPEKFAFLANEMCKMLFTTDCKSKNGFDNARNDPVQNGLHEFR